MEPWGEFDPAYVAAQMQAAGCAMHFLTAPTKTYDKEIAPDYPTEAISESKGRTHFVAILPLSDNYDEWFSHCNSSSVVVFEGISRNRQLWQRIIASKQVTISFDLYYCGIVMLDTKRTKQHYIVNF